MEIKVFSNKDEYINFAKELKEFPLFEIGEPFIFKNVYRLSRLYRSYFSFVKRMMLKGVVKEFTKLNKIATPKLVFTSDNNIKSACLKTKSKTIVFQNNLLKNGFWFCFVMLTHELSHYLIYSDNELHKSIMTLSKETKESLKEHTTENNIVLPEELYANGVMNHLLINCYSDTKEFINSLFDRFKKELTIL